METPDVGYFTTHEAAAKLGCSAATVSRAARRNGIGVFLSSGRLAALTPADVLKIKPLIHTTSGNPNWIAQRRQA